MAASKPGIGARFLIMIYAAALVAIGAYPIQNEYGSVSAFVKRQIAKLTPDTSKRPMSELRVNRPMPEGSEASSARSRLATPKKQESLDSLSRNDRGELDALINTLEP